jgi:spore coat protein A, manganese oxidase
VSISRRDFLLKGGLIAGAFAIEPSLQAAEWPPKLPLCRPRNLPAGLKQPLVPPGPVRPMFNVGTLTPFVDALPIPEVIRSSESRPDPAHPHRKLPYYRLTMRQIESQVHRDMKPTRFWSYGAGMPGPTFETRSGQALLVEWANQLPEKHFLPIDYRLHGAEPGQPEVRTVVHVHGGRTPSDSDGYPDDWYVPGKSALYRYPNQQDAATLWYHDHAMGINRLNIYAGLFGAYIIRDEAEDALNLPRDEFDIPLLLCDRLFYRDDHQLNYPTADYAGAPWVPEVKADGTLINGKLFPYLEVQPRKYRFRIISAANSSFYNLSLSQGLAFQQIGTDQGLLPAPVARSSMLIAPAERIDVVIDFSQHAGQNITLNNIPNALLQFRVANGAAADKSVVPAKLRPVAPIQAPAGVKVRRMTLNEHDNRVGEPVTMLLNDMSWEAPVTEKPVLGSTEIWEFMNLTDDVHPIHLHLVRFQILNRQSFRVPDYLQLRKLTGLKPPVPPEPGEAGWKDTVQVYPGTITRIIVRFDGYVGRYLWHCHILEHEANDMMRPFVVLPHKA